MTVQQAYQIALHHHQSGRLADAEALYRQILAMQPNHADALQLLGVIALQSGRLDLAVDLIRQSIVFHPNNPFAQCNLGAALYARGQFGEASAAYRRALELKTDYAEAHYNLGNALREQGQFDEAMVAFRRALELKPGYPEAHNDLGNALADRGQFEEAIAAYRHALELEPDYPKAHYNLGNALRRRGNLDEAVAAHHRALGLKPDWPEGHNSLGNALAGQGQFEEAIAAFHRAIQIKPDYSEAHSNLGNVLRERGNLDEAVAAYRRALELKPDLPEGYNNLGGALKDQGRLDEAIAAYRYALELKPDLPDGHNNLGSALMDLGRLDEAIAEYRCAVQLKQKFPEAHSNLVYALHFHPDHNDRSIAEEHQRWNIRFSNPLKQFILPHANDPSPDRRLRIGYVSPDFSAHVIGRYLLPLFERHDRERFELLCYSGVTRADWATERFRAATGGWRNTVGVSDGRLAEMIREDGVDILVDLTQHLAGNRLSAFAHKPAPVQVSFAGYPESTGLEAIEYRISDRYLERASVDERTERREHVSLVDSFWCYDASGIDADVSLPPALESGTVTFGCLNIFRKVNERVLSLWARVLGKVADTRLILLSPAGSYRNWVLGALEREGVEARRVEFVERSPWNEYMHLYHRLDIVLDTFPYNGHTTSLDALWMGVPVISLAGVTPVSRAGLSQLSNLGLPELVAHSETEYVKIARDLAGDLPRLAQLRSTLRTRMENSILMDGPRFARNIEAAYRTMWKRWCAQTVD